MRELISKDAIAKDFTFHYDNLDNNVDQFFCRCGHRIDMDRKTSASEIKVSVREGNDITDFTNLFGSGSIARFNLNCDKCNTDYSTIENSRYVQEANKEFMESYCFQEDDNSIRIIKQRFAGHVIKEEVRTAFVVKTESDNTIELRETLYWIRFNKEDKKLFYKSATEIEHEITLDKVLSIVKTFFSPVIVTGNERKETVKFTERLFDVHLFVDRMANFVSDSKNMNIIEEIMSQMVGKAGLDIIEKVTSIFFGIISYSNLSTIALTKGTVFLYDMMNDCHLPNVKELSDNGATSPLKIFNYLVNYKNVEIIEEFKADDKESAGYVFKGKGGLETNLKFDSKRFDQARQTERTHEGEIFIKEDITKKSVSPYIFNKIIKFSDYKILIKYTKFISYAELIELVKKHDIRLLVGIMNIIEMRNGLNIAVINQFLSLGMDAVRRKALLDKNIINSKLDSKFVRDQYSNIEEDLEKSPIVFDEALENELVELYDFTVLKYFDFTNYDDSLRMIFALRWDPAKEFYKLKTIESIEEYHDQLQEHFSLLSDDEKNKDFTTFVRKYQFLEDYDSAIFKIRTIKTPDSLLNQAKEMKNCASSYVNRVSSQQYLLCIIEDTDPLKDKKEVDKYMLGLRADKRCMLEFDQVKGPCNIQGSDRFKKNMMKYLEDKDISYKELSDLRLSTSKNYIKPQENNDIIELLLRTQEAEVAQMRQPQNQPRPVQPPPIRNYPG
jgi:hypothetical protein